MQVTYPTHGLVRLSSHLGLRCLAVNLLLILGSYITIPNPIVPITLQTLTVCLAGLLLGPTLGAATVLLWLGEAIVGLPVLANGTLGIAAFVGPTAGYLFSFPMMAWLMGTVRRQSLWVMLLMSLFAYAFCLSMGSLVLSLLLDSTVAQGFSLGFLPFISGSLIKIALFLCVVKALTVVKRVPHL